MGDEEYPRPARIDAFAYIPGTLNASLVGREGRQDWFAYADGYRRAARLIAEFVLQDPSEHDLLVYPGVFLYRHYLELRLKEIVVRGRWVAELPAVDVTAYNHNLAVAWRDAKETLLRLFPPGALESEYYKAIDVLIEQFAAIDPDSAAFRYPVKNKKKGGGPSLPDLEYMHVGQLATAVEQIADFLDGSVMAIEERREGELEARAEWHDE